MHLANNMCSFYCLSFNNIERKTQMKNRFTKLNLDVQFYDGVNMDDERISNVGGYGSWSCMYGHLDMINKFLNETDKEYGVFCEDDIYIHKEFADDIPKIIHDFKTMNLDVLLLGYLIIHPPSTEKIIKNYYSYHDHLWGSQMYMISRSHAKNLIQKYYGDYAVQSLTTNITPFSADWTITKDGNRAMVYPMYAVEDGKKQYEWNDQEVLHKGPFTLIYDELNFI
jgi:GR25 family glycosyltransferase involved in LPS biosynthesis